MDNILVVVFDGERQAYRGYSALRQLHAEGQITLCGEALISKDPSGQVVVTEGPEPSPSETVERLVTGSVIGLLGPVGSVVSAEIVDRVAGYLQPGQSAVVAEVQEGLSTVTDSRLEAVGGKVIRRAAAFAVDEQIRRDSAELGATIARLQAEYERSRGEAKARLSARIEAAKAELKRARDRARE